jgi:hypothetical protein
MDTRQTFHDRFKVELGEWGSKVEALKEQAAKAESDAQAKVKPHVEQVQTRLEHARDRLTEIAGSTDEAWGKLREGFEKSWLDLKTAFDAASKVFEDGSKKSTGPDTKKN